MKFLQFAVSLGLIVLFVSCESVPSQSWSEGMRGMAESFEKLFPYIYDSRKFSDPKNSKIIETHLKELLNDSESLDKHIALGLSGHDPLFIVGLQGLKKNLQRAQESYYVESFAYAQDVLQNSVNYCVQCHTRTSLGPNFNVYDKFSSENLAQINKIDLAKLQVATRQFEKALESLTVEANTQSLDSDKQMSALKFAMTIALRNLTSDEIALGFLSKVKINEKNENIINQWKKDLGDNKKMSLKQAQLYRVDTKTANKQFIESLKSSLVLHQSLSLEQDKLKRGKSYLALGNIYKNHSNFGAKQLPEQYFEACILEVPHTNLAKKCYFNLERSVLKLLNLKEFEQLPKTEKSHLLKMKALAAEKKATTRPMGGHDSL